jgi:hypothetical protein
MKASSLKIAIGTLMFSYHIETLQYFSIVDRLGLSKNILAKTVIGYGFDWWDILAYTLGICLVLVMEYWRRHFTSNIIADNAKYRKKQKRLFIWTTIALLIFVLAWIMSTYREVFGFHYHGPGDNFAFNFTYFYPPLFFSLLVCYFTAGHTIFDWRRLQNKKLGILTLSISLVVIFYTCYKFVLILKDH